MWLIGKIHSTTRRNTKKYILSIDITSILARLLGTHFRTFSSCKLKFGKRCYYLSLGLCWSFFRQSILEHEGLSWWIWCMWEVQKHRSKTCYILQCKPTSTVLLRSTWLSNIRSQRILSKHTLAIKRIRMLFLLFFHKGVGKDGAKERNSNETTWGLLSCPQPPNSPDPK